MLAWRGFGLLNHNKNTNTFHVSNKRYGDGGNFICGAEQDIVWSQNPPSFIPADKEVTIFKIRNTETFSDGWSAASCTLLFQASTERNITANQAILSPNGGYNAYFGCTGCKTTYFNADGLWHNVAGKLSKGSFNGQRGYFGIGGSTSNSGRLFFHYVWRESAPVTTPGIRVASVRTLPVLYLVRKKTVTLPAAVQPHNAANQKVTWKSSKNKIVSVNKRTGKIKGLRKGKATLTVTTDDGKKISKCRVSVVPRVIKLKRFLRIPKISILSLGSIYQITPTCKPKRATGIVPTYKSSNPKVVSVGKAGIITTRSCGKATVTFKAKGRKVKVNVIVK